MICNKRMKLVKSENDYNYYIFKPSIFNLYYKDYGLKREEPPHRYNILHKLHMILYILTVRGGYRILYLEKDDKILSYIVFVKVNNLIIKNSDGNDYYTIFVWTYPEYRCQGVATLMAKTMLYDLSLDYNNFYKTISKDNIPSMKVAEKCGFEIKCDSIKKGLLHTINCVEEGEQYLYCYIKNKND